MEIVSFRLIPGTTDAAFLTAARATATPLQAQPGFLARHLTRAEDGTWTDHVLWSALAAARAGPEAMMAEPAFGPFMALIDGPTVAMRHDRVAFAMD
jgi:heme-degrading monooxygenase HmoA